MYGVSDMVVVVIFLVVEVISFVGVVSSKYGVKVVVNSVLAIGIIVVDIIAGNMVFGGVFVVVALVAVAVGNMVIVVVFVVDACVVYFPIATVLPFVVVICVD